MLFMLMLLFKISKYQCYVILSSVFLNFAHMYRFLFQIHVIYIVFVYLFEREQEECIAIFGCYIYRHQNMRDINIVGFRYRVFNFTSVI